ncbi:MAG TPA: GNAT family N-acetyltransferase [Burkholderiales bacterium]|nr:GNAT family N-acetyltransferase [Burkholderiales bacterium]
MSRSEQRVSGGERLAVRVVEDLAQLSAGEWNALAGGNPFLRHEFFSALHETGCASARSGWLPRFVTLWDGKHLRGALPLYLKSHSYGEYVFDWAWADAYARHGLEYYPKLLAAVPFSPVTGARLLARDPTVRAQLVATALELARGASSLHVLFPLEGEARELEAAGMMLRRGVQFHWTNAGYASFDAFLAALTHDKRKKIRQERRRVAEAGVTFRRKVGAEITREDWRFFTRCYNLTYRAHMSSPYLNLAFFTRLGETLPEHVLLVLAERDGRPIASALNVFTADALYGRYWGAIDHVPCLHFETCYYQALEFCIERGIRAFEGGAQGEHKLARGFLPEATWSAHWLAHPRFADAVERFLAREAQGVARYADELAEHSPFRRPDPAQGE